MADDGWAALQECYRGTGLTLVLGAGVSSGSAFPSWGGLIERLLEKQHGTKAPDAFRKLVKAGLSLTTITQAIKLAYPDDGRGFIDATKEALYRTFPCRDVLKAYEEPGIKRILEHVRSCNPTLAAVHDLATVER